MIWLIESRTERGFDRDLQDLRIIMIFEEGMIKKIKRKSIYIHQILLYTMYYKGDTLWNNILL